MSDEISIKINSDTFQKIKRIKEEMDFGEKNWDEWFNEIFIIEEESDKDAVERIIRTNAQEYWYEDWVRNFALNLKNIWNGKNVKELSQNTTSKSCSGLVIGRGPSIRKHNHLELLSTSKFKGPIICSDAGLPSVLEAGVTPEKYDLYVLTIDAQEIQKYGYEHDLSKKYGNGIKCILSTTSHPKVFEAVKNAGMDIYWVHTLTDYNSNKNSFNRIQGIMTKALDNEKRIPAIQTGGNVGTAAWILAWSILKCSHVGMIGIDHGYDANTPWNEIYIHGGHPFPKDTDQNSEAFKRAYPTIFNSGFNCYCKQDPLFVYYSNALKDFIHSAKDKVNTINVTEGGSIFGENIECITFKEFLTNYNF